MLTANEHSSYAGISRLQLTANKHSSDPRTQSPHLITARLTRYRRISLAGHKRRKRTTQYGQLEIASVGKNLRVLGGRTCDRALLRSRPSSRIPSWPTGLYIQPTCKSTQQRIFYELIFKFAARCRFIRRERVGCNQGKSQ